MNAFSDGVALIRMNGQILFANTHFCKLVGVSHTKVAGMSYFDFVFPEDFDAARRLLQTNERLNAESFTLRLRRLDGVAIWVDIKPLVMKWPDGEVYAISAEVTALAEKPSATATGAGLKGEEEKENLPV